PPGNYLMGASNNEKASDPARERKHEVRLTWPFDLGVYEVTQEQYAAVFGQNPSHARGAQLPVEQVSWQEARDFGELLTKKLGNGHEFGLPTEAEWEYACRAGRASELPFGVGNGDSLSSSQANFRGKFPYGTAHPGPFLNGPCAVGSYEANAF